MHSLRGFKVFKYARNMRANKSCAQKMAKKQHYVAQAALLEPFATAAGGRLFVLNKKEGKVFPSRPRDVGHENGFYDYLDSEGLLRNIEGATSKLDNAVSPLFARIRRDRTVGWLNSMQRELVGSYFIAQILRTPHGRGISRRIAGALDSSSRKFPIGSDAWVMAQTDDNASADTSFGIIESELHEIFGLLHDKRLLLLSAEAGKHTFYTSDRPVVIINQAGEGRGLGCPNLEAYLPIAPTLLVSFFGTNAGKKYASNSGEAIPIADSEIVRLNQSQVRFCTRYVYSASESFDTAFCLLNKDPSTADPFPVVASWEKGIFTVRGAGP